MEITIEGQKREIKVTSVILEADEQNPCLSKMFFCINCGSAVVRYLNGHITDIIPGETPASLPLISFCRKCKTQYLFNSIV